MKYEVLIQPSAEAELEAAYLHLCREASQDTGAEWFDSVVDAILTLEEMPHRCPLAPESEFFEEELRHLLLKPYRVIFTIRGVYVHIVHLRHMSQQSLKSPER